MSQTPEERRNIERMNLLGVLQKFKILGEFTREGFESAVTTILNRRVQRPAETNATARRRSQRRTGKT